MHYLVVAQYRKVLCDYAKGKNNYEEFTNEILKSIKKGRTILPYDE